MMIMIIQDDTRPFSCVAGRCRGIGVISSARKEMSGLGTSYVD